MSQKDQKYGEIPLYDYREGRSNLSFTSTQGVKYERYFTLEGNSIASSLAPLTIENKDEETEGKGTYTFLTEFKLDDNFAGEILSAQTTSDDGVATLTFRLVIPDMLNDSNVLNNDRNKIE